MNLFSKILVKTVINIINNLNIVQYCFRMKKDAWTKIQNEFNCPSIDNPRSAEILKNKYVNIKRKVKKQYADEKIYNRGTGGGLSKSFIQSSVAVSITEIYATKQSDWRKF